MKRDQRLLELSRDHYQALRLARDLERSLDETRQVHNSAELVALGREQLLAHFAEEERSVVPALWANERREAAARLITEHREIAALLASVMTRDRVQLLARLLREHVRYEEREAFEQLQGIWTARQIKHQAINPTGEKT